MNGILFNICFTINGNIASRLSFYAKFDGKANEKYNIPTTL